MLGNKSACMIPGLQDQTHLSGRKVYCETCGDLPSLLRLAEQQAGLSMASSG